MLVSDRGRESKKQNRMKGESKSKDREGRKARKGENSGVNETRRKGLYRTQGKEVE